jgi:vitamin B12 transporter
MRKYLFFVAALIIGSPVCAQEAPAGPPDTVGAESETSITVLANGTRQILHSTGQSISVFGRDEMDAVQGADLTRLLERASGVGFNRNGGPGAFTSLHVRGSEGEQVLVLVDGVRVADPAAPGGGFDLGNLLMGNLAKVELQRSSNSTIWGSQALGGVLAVTTGSDPGLRASAEYGAYDTVYGSAAAAFDVGPVTLGLQGGHYDSDGFSAAAAGTEPDGFRQTELAGRGEVRLLDRLSLFARGRYAEGHLDIDGFPAPTFTLADTAEYQDTRQLSGAAGLRYASERLELTGAWSAAQTERLNYDPAFGPEPGYTTDGISERAELRGRWRFAGSLALNFGGEREWTRFSTLFDPIRRTALTGVYGQLDYDGGALHLAAGVRRDDHRDFGGEWSLGADAAYELSSRWRLFASYGEGFKAPTLFQLHSDFGNAALQPERSRSYDGGIAYSGRSAGARLTAFRRDTHDLIGFVSCFGAASGICAGRPFGTYDNIGRARAQGIELEGHATLARRFQLGAAYTYLEAIDRTPGSSLEGNDLARRPRHALTVSGDWHSERLRLGADLRAVSDSFDDPANAVPLDGYAVLTLRGEWDAAEAVTLYGRVENALDEHYQTAAGYATAGRSASVGARLKL